MTACCICCTYDAAAALSVKQIANDLGFVDEAYFGRFFRKHAALSPKEFRQMARQRLAATAGEPLQT